MAEKERVWLLHDNQEGYAVFISRKNDVDLCVLPYTIRQRADQIKDAYSRIGYIFMGIKREGDLL